MKKGDQVIITNGTKKRFIGIIKDIKDIKGCAATVVLHHKAQEVKTCLNDIKLYKQF